MPGAAGTSNRENAMRALYSCGCLLVLLAAGCGSTSEFHQASSGPGVGPPQRSLAAETAGLAAARNKAPIALASHTRNAPVQLAQREEGPKHALQPGVGEVFLEPPAVPEPPPPVETLKELEHPAGTEGALLTLETLEQWACENNPTLLQARAVVEGNFGKAIEAGLWPNPRVFYIQEQIGIEDTPGEFVGGAVQQEIVTADKRDISRAKFLERTRTAEWLAVAQEYRVLNDVRAHYYRVLGRQQIVDLHRELLKNAEDNLVTEREAYNVGQATRATVHQANITLQQQRLDLLMAQNDLVQAWEELTALVGVDLPLSPLAGPLDEEFPVIEWDAALSRLQRESPELQAAWAKLRSDQLTVKREKVEPIPNIFVQAGAGTNFEANGVTVGALQVFAEVPIWDWNQGTVKQAEADLVRQRGEIRRTELRLKRELAQVYRQYLTALQFVENYEQIIIPEARNAYEVRLDSYKADRIRWADVLDTERQFFLLQVEYVQNLIRLRESEVLIVGYMLHGGLQAPMDPVPPSHIDAVPQPR